MFCSEPPRHSRVDGNPEGWLEGVCDLQIRLVWIPACAGLAGFGSEPSRRSGAGVCDHIAKWPIYSLITGVNLGSLSPLRGFIHKLAGRNPVCWPGRMYKL